MAIAPFGVKNPFQFGLRYHLGMTKQQEITMTEEQLAKEKQALQGYSEIQQPLFGPGEQIPSTLKDIEDSKREIQRLQDKIKQLRG